ncbi:Pentatricopeptide repeat-containing protein [Apostasia shenzhenica]|uniref:Pentatricopeptide repeat-containing protein n=1 Tax=Apostasia shenzhenica TaxID=1088818 RepID=A0A2I0ARK5_9ASPA|nr:Pentatricopeptide repeat-containing protein [Apostasia shenzhenica]
MASSFFSPFPSPSQISHSHRQTSAAAIATQFSSFQPSSSSPSPRSSSSIQLSVSDYNSLIKAHTDAGRSGFALLLFHRMLAIDALLPDRFTFPSVLKACALLPAAAEGEQIHSLVLKSFFAPADDIFVLTTLVHFYARCSRLSDARLVFDKMPHRNPASWNSMLDGYARSGAMESAHMLFDEMPERNIFSWNILIGGYVRDGLPLEALKLFYDLRFLGLSPDESTMAIVITAISDHGLLSLGRMAHAYVFRRMFSLHGALAVALIHMYAESGSIEAAQLTFFITESKNVRHWTALIAGFAVHGLANSALQLFDEMLHLGIRPNHITFVSVLTACSHAGLVHEGLKLFKLMSRFGIEPGVEHYGCLVDLLSRVGLLEEAMEVVRGIPIEPGPVIWSSLLAACRNFGHAEMAQFAARKLIELDSSNGSSYALLSNLCARLGRWEDFRTVRIAMEEREAGKVAGLSWIEICGHIHEFVSGDRKHSRTADIYKVLDEMSSFLRLGEAQDHLFLCCSCTV